MKRILLVSDGPTWAWARMADGIAKYAPDGFDVTVMDQKGLNTLIRTDLMKLPGFDAICHFSWMESPHHTVKNHLPIKRLVTLVASHGIEYEFEVPVDPTDLRKIIATPIRNLKRAQKMLPRFASVLCVSKRLHAIAVQLTDAAVRVVPGVDHEVFDERPLPNGEKIIVGWCAQKPDDDKNNTKGYREVLLPLMERLGDKVEFRINSRNAQDALTQAEMLDWYTGVDVMLSTSCSEGFQMPLLEGASCGRPVVATYVGGTDELIESGKTGYVVEAWKNLEETKATIDQLEMVLTLYSQRRDMLLEHGRASRERVVRDFTWARRAPEWLGIIGG